MFDFCYICVVNVIKNIAVFYLVTTFLVSATGVLVFHAHCSCSGNDQVSVYVSPETCEEVYHVHHTHNEGGEEVCASAVECHECTAHTDNCGCATPEVRYFKLESQVVKEKVRIEKIQPVQLKVLEEFIVALLDTDNNSEKIRFNYIDPPPLFQTASDYLIHLQKLKIPVLA